MKVNWDKQTITSIQIDTTGMANIYIDRLLKLIAEQSQAKATCYDAYGQEVLE
tara:strand:+ start:349 stop:507 length:159 start_codon:yes stop_codon:yes gene_type:complete